MDGLVAERVVAVVRARVPQKMVVAAPPHSTKVLLVDFCPAFEKRDQPSSQAKHARQKAGQRSTRLGAAAAVVLPHGGLGLFMVVRL